MPDFSPVITLAYMRILGRRPDPGGLASWNRSMNDGLSVQNAAGYPLLVNDYPTIPTREVERQVLRAEQLGTMFEYWRGDHNEREWSETLDAIGRETRSRVARSGARPPVAGVPVGAHPA